MKIKIERISRKEIQTSRGPAWKVAVLQNKVWYSCFANDWNKTWKEGQTIDVEVEQKGNYWNIIPPKTMGARVPSETTDYLAQIMKEILEIKKILMVGNVKLADDEPPPHTDADMPPEEEDIPF